MMSTFKDIKPNQRVYYMNSVGQISHGKACRMLLFPEHVVIDIGRGQPQVVDESNYINKGALNSTRPGEKGKPA